MIVATLVLLVGCASDEAVEQVERPVDELYNEALASALAGDTKAAAPQFEEVERQHPYSSLAVQAQIMAAWAFYQENDYPRAVAALQRFIELARIANSACHSCKSLQNIEQQLVPRHP